ncbi:MAG TPA: hypothetical protein VM095_16485, partial [Pyrinomonadaceae bacterium]|nr:hypothetical protein [Pyrinomonadaceae bacterium]
SFWVLDDLPVLHQMADAMDAAPAFLFKPEDAYRFQGGGGPPLSPTATIGQNPPAGAVVYYYLKEKPSGQITLEFMDSAGRSIKKFMSRAPEPAPQATPGAGAPSQTPPEQPQAPSGEEVEAGEGGGRGGTGSRRIPAEAGLNRFVWDTRYADAARFPGLILWAGELRGPRAMPGIYQVKLTVNGKTWTQSFEIKKDPRLAISPADFAKQFDLLIKIRDKLTETHEAITGIREVRKQVDELVKRVKDQPNSKSIIEAAKSLNAKLKGIEEELYQTKNQSSQDPLNYPIRLNNKLAAVAGVVASADAAPNEQSYTVYEEQVGKINAQLQRLEQIMRTDLAAFNQLVREQNIPAVILKPSANTNPTGTDQRQDDDDDDKDDDPE